MIIEVDINKLPDRYSKDLRSYDERKTMMGTRYHNRILQFRKAEEDYWKDLSDKQVEDLLIHFEKLYKKIKKKGYADEPYIKGEVYKKGGWKIKGGYHRISILKHLGHKTVKIDWKIHPSFQKFYDHICKLYPSNRMYQYIDHILFSTWSCVRGSNRPELIMNNLRRGKKYSVLEIGSYLGDISSHMALKHHKVTAIELDERLFESSKYLARYMGANVNFINGDVAKYFVETNQFMKNQYFDVIIMLSVDRWISKAHGDDGLNVVFEEIYKRCGKFFFFESRGRHETKALNLLEELGFKDRKKIGIDDGETKRTIWKLSK